MHGHTNIIFIYSLGKQILNLIFSFPNASQVPLIHEASRSHTQRRTTVGKTPLDEWWARRRDLYLATHNTHNRQTSIRPVGFEPTISAGERPQTYALDRAATWIGIKPNVDFWFVKN